MGDNRGEQLGKNLISDNENNGNEENERGRGRLSSVSAWFGTNCNWPKVKDMICASWVWAKGKLKTGWSFFMKWWDKPCSIVALLGVLYYMKDSEIAKIVSGWVGGVGRKWLLGVLLVGINIVLFLVGLCVPSITDFRLVPTEHVYANLADIALNNAGILAAMYFARISDSSRAAAIGFFAFMLLWFCWIRMVKVQIDFGVFALLQNIALNQIVAWENGTQPRKFTKYAVVLYILMGCFRFFLERHDKLKSKGVVKMTEFIQLTRRDVGSSYDASVNIFGFTFSGPLGLQGDTKLVKLALTQRGDTVDRELSEAEMPDDFHVIFRRDEGKDTCDMSITLSGFRYEGRLPKDVTHATPPPRQNHRAMGLHH